MQTKLGSNNDRQQKRKPSKSLSTVLNLPPVPSEEDPLESFLWISATTHLNISETKLASPTGEKLPALWTAASLPQVLWAMKSHRESQRWSRWTHLCVRAQTKMSLTKRAVKFTGTSGTVCASLSDIRKEMRKTKHFSKHFWTKVSADNNNPYMRLHGLDSKTNMYLLHILSGTLSSVHLLK